MSTQQQAQAGDNARIIQIIGDHNVVGDSPHLFITPLPPARPAPAEPAKDEASLLRPVIEATDFVGRESLMADFVAWAKGHKPERPVSVRVVHGGAGVGKTRFALELCRALGPDWQAGFVTNAEARRTLGRGNLGAWQWPKPTLIVFDYALSLTDTLRVWLEELCAATPRAHPLRILLLERQADAQSGWLERLLQSGFGQYEMMPRELLDGEPLRLPDLSSPAVRIGIMQNMLARLGSRVVLPADNADFQAKLAATDWAGAPLYLMMAAMVMHQQGDAGEVLHLGRVDLAQTVADHEYVRVLCACGGDDSRKFLLPHIAAFATLCGGLAGQSAMDCITREKKAFGCESVSTAPAKRLLAELLPDGGQGVAAILPDIVGEAFLLKHLAGGDQNDGERAVMRAFGEKPSEVTAVLVRCVQDFAPRAESDASGRARAAGQRAMVWLRALGDRPDLPLETLLVLTGALPESTAALRELAVEWQSRVVEHLRQQQDGSIAQRVILATSLNNFANRLSDAGQRQKALDAAQDSTALYRQLDDAKPDIFRPHLAMSLNALANSFGDMGQHENALSVAQEAVDIHRELNSNNLQKYITGLAVSLITLGTTARDANYRSEALTATEEATDLYRQLSTINPKFFQSALAGCLNNLAALLTDAGKHKEALIPAKESVTIYRELNSTNTDAYKFHLALSIDTLSNCLSEPEQAIESLILAQESTAIFRDLVKENPKPFMPNLANSLNNLSNKYHAVNSNDLALSAAHESVELYRTLASDNPDAFRADLARSINNQSHKLSEVGLREKALPMARESAQLYAILANQRPDTFGQYVVAAMLTWLSLRYNISREEAFALLKQNPQAQIDVLFNDDDSDAPSPSDNPPAM